jgi:hypothetical protein
MCVLLAVLPQETLHEPRFSVSWIDVEDSIEKNLRNVPTFLRDCAGDVAPIDPDHRVLSVGVGCELRLEKTHREHFRYVNDDEDA